MVHGRDAHKVGIFKMRYLVKRGELLVPTLAARGFPLVVKLAEAEALTKAHNSPSCTRTPVTSVTIHFSRDRFARILHQFALASVNEVFEDSTQLITHYEPGLERMWKQW